LAVFNGAGAFDLQSEFNSLDGNRMRTYLLDYDATYEDVAIDLNNLRAVGGNATFVVHAERTASNRFRDVEAEFDIVADVTFTENGPQIVLDGDRYYDFQQN
jgi:hypothetical protein